MMDGDNDNTTRSSNNTTQFYRTSFERHEMLQESMAAKDGCEGALFDSTNRLGSVNAELQFNSNFIKMTFDEDDDYDDEYDDDEDVYEDDDDDFDTMLEVVIMNPTTTSINNTTILATLTKDDICHTRNTHTLKLTNAMVNLMANT